MKILKTLLIGLCIFGLATSAYAADKTLKQYGKTKISPKTGQTTSYVDYDDGYYETGSPASPRFVDNGDGTISDRVTGLMWVKQPELIIPGTSVIASNQIQVAHGDWETSHAYDIGDLVSSDGSDAAPYYVCIVAHTSGTFATDLAAGKWILTIWTATAAGLTTPKTMSWANAITNSEALDYAGFTDWRLPNIKENMSIVDYEIYSPAIDQTYFPNTQSGIYWSGTTDAGWSDGAWNFYFSYGGVSNSGKSSGYYVRPVRSCK